MKITALIVAAGTGKRMKSAVAKQYIEFKGKPVLAHTIEAFNRPCIHDMVIVVGEDEVEFVRENIVGRLASDKKIRVVSGGKERQDSVRKGLEALCEECEAVFIHDGVRPFIKEEILEKAAEDTEKYGCTIVAVPVKNTVKTVGEDGFVESTPERSKLWAAQTPQCFKKSIITEVYRKAYEEGFLGTDDSMLAERYGKKVHITMGSYDNIKITTPEDMYSAEKIATEYMK
ncbi:MAG: 2-C-methyl-D-erythritol 4-phosphate cytidylyltransferase [Firmicutes bacterium]|nr:2-C-methyl-D-erythritol 4-phosphate cytidylyltransferase [Bacillota bacterium]